MEREVPPGYVPWGEQGMELVDPTSCPAGHPFVWGKRSIEPCPEHHGHPSWVCRCGRELFLREDGTIVAALGCVSR
jgi:hypothetical protein